MDWFGKLFKKEKKEKAEAGDRPQAAVTVAAPPPQGTGERAPSQAETPPQAAEAPAEDTGPPESSAQAVDKAGEARQAESGPAGDEETAALTIKGVLKKLLMTEGVTGAMVVSSDGFLLAHAGYTGSDQEAVAVLASSQVGAAASLSEELQTGKLTQMVVDFNERRVIMESIGEGLILALVASRESNLGMLRLVINNIKESILTSLTQA